MGRRSPIDEGALEGGDSSAPFRAATEFFANALAYNAIAVGIDAGPRLGSAGLPSCFRVVFERPAARRPRAALRAFRFSRVHRSYLVNANRIRTIRRRGRDWEIQLDPPVNAVIPVSREAYARVMKAFEG
ncbi:MAG TPA: LytTR family transcriptional regulator DNA-binding domain-containing protein [Thermoanaerobaculia bacterium]